MILDSPIISGSLTQQAGQTAEIPRYTAVSSSFLAASASFDARIDSIESTTASFSPRINALESFTASANATYVNATGDSMSGNLTITGSLVVTDRITAQEFHTEYVSSSVVFQSGSTKFGDSGDDRHSFTGSVEIDGTIKASNLDGIFSSSAQITGSLGNYYIVSGTITQTTWDNIANKPNGIVSGSSQLTASLDSHYIVSGTITQTTWDNIALKPAGIVSGAMQVTESLDVRYRLIGAQVSYSDISNRPTLISSSLQFTSSTDPFTGSFSGSFAGNGSLLTGLAAGAKFHTQTEAASTWTFVHNLSTQYPNVTVYGSNSTIILPQSITAINSDTLVLEFGTPVSGYATAGIGGIIEVNGRTIKQYFTSALEWRFEHNFGDRFANIQTYDANYEKVIPQTIALTDTTSSLIVFPEATEGWAIGTIGGDLPAISSSYGGYVLQVSDSAPYTASWTAAANVVVTNALTASHLNPISQSLIPAVSGTYDLGSPTNPWRHIYVGSGSIYLVDNTGNVVKTLTGDSLVTNDNLSSLNAFTASNSTINTFTSSASARLNSIETISASNIARLNAVEIISASNIARIGSIESFTSSTSARLNSIETISASNIARISALETKSASVDTLNTTQNTRLTNLETKTGSLATTGSNTFYGTQVFSGSLYVQDNLVVQGSSSLQNITASAVSIGTNTVLLNTATPSVRFGGLSVVDSGSAAGKSGSLYFDSTDNEWIFVHAGNTAVTSSTVITGPETYDSIGNETHLTDNKIPKMANGFHIVDSNISDNGTLVTINSATSSFSGTVGIGTTNPLGKFEIWQAAGNRLVVGNVNILNEPKISSLDASGNPQYLTLNSYDLKINANGTEALRITELGKVGIGTTSPNQLFHIYKATTDALSVIQTTGNASSAHYYMAKTGGVAKNYYAGINISNSNGGYEIYDDSAGASRLIINTSGKVGIGTTNPGYTLDVQGAQSNIRISSTTGTNSTILRVSNTGGEVYFGRESSAGGDLATASSAYATVINSQNSYPIQMAVNNAIGLTMTSNGVGIGTTANGNSKLVVRYSAGGTDPSEAIIAAVLGDTATIGTALLSIKNAGNRGTIGNANGSTLFKAEFSDATAMIITKDGYVGIGVTNPGYSLHVVKDGAAGATADMVGSSFVSSRTNSQSESIAIRHTSSTNGLNGGTHAGQIISNGNNSLEIYTSAGSPIIFGTNSTARVKIDNSAIYPFTNNSVNLGTSTYAWANLYTNDLHLSNMSKEGGNDVDGTNGNWTIQEGAENLYIINNNNGKKFKIKLEEII